MDDEYYAHLVSGAVDFDPHSHTYQPPSSPTLPSRQARKAARAGGPDKSVNSLADELAGAMGGSDDDDDYDDDEEYDDEEGEYEESERGAGIDEVMMNGDVHDSPRSGRARRDTVSSIKSVIVNGHNRTKSKASIALSSPKSRRRSTQTTRQSIGSTIHANDADDESDLEDLIDGLTPGLLAMIKECEDLVAEGKRIIKSHRERIAADDAAAAGSLFTSSYNTTTTGYGQPVVPRIQQTDEDTGMSDVENDLEIIPRFVDGLRNLPPQSTLESATARLTTANNAVASHIERNSLLFRDLLFALAHTAYVFPEDDDTPDRIDACISSIPVCHPTSLSQIHQSTAETLSALASIQDAVHMERQANVHASRKTRFTREIVSGWKREMKEAEEAEQMLAAGDAQERIAQREASREVEGIMDGFEAVVEGFGSVLRGQMEDERRRSEREGGDDEGERGWEDDDRESPVKPVSWKTGHHQPSVQKKVVREYEWDENETY